MSLLDFETIRRFMGAGKPTAEEKAELFKEVALMTLSRATSADTRIKPIETQTVQAILKRLTGEEISTSDIRVAAGSALFERRPLHKYLAAVGRKLEAGERATIIRGLAEVLHSDDRISHFETDYFDMVAKALKATPSEIAGLVEHSAPRPHGGPR